MMQPWLANILFFNIFLTLSLSLMNDSAADVLQILHVYRVDIELYDFSTDFIPQSLKLDTSSALLQ